MRTQLNRWSAALILALGIGLGIPLAWSAETNVTVVDLNKLPFFLGREYFVLRSGRAQMILQADRADLGPAFTYLLFDVENARQSLRKENAYNFTPGEGFEDSGLLVELGGFPFTALGHRTETRWTMEDGIPAVEAVWWAGPVRVTERIVGLENVSAFRRSIRMEGAHLVGTESVTLRLALPQGQREREGRVLVQSGRGARTALAVLGGRAAQIREDTGTVAVGPISVAPKQSVTVETVLVVQIPAGDRQLLIERVNPLLASSASPELSATRERWARSSTVTTADRTVQEIYDKARFGLPGMVADDGTMDAGLFEYGAQWVRDTSCTALGALHAGHFETARAALGRILTKMISRDGATIAGGFDKPDMEQFDQMGELLHLLRAYRDWTGDDSLIREHRELLLALIERPLRPEFRDDSGLVHNRREFWERWFTDAYELAYQTYVILGLRDAAELAPALGAADRAARWRSEADKMLQAVLHHPTRALVDRGRLIKRRKVTGEVADYPDAFKGFQPDAPMNTEQHHSLLPDASMALPIALGVIDPRSDVSLRTLDDLEELWNTRWSDGGYDRYHTSTQPDQPGPWPFATTFILRAQHDAGLFERSRRSLEWLDTCPGGRSGFFFEEIPSIRSLNKSCGLVCWTSGEIALFVVHHYLGVPFGPGGELLIKPALYPGSPEVKADLRFRQGRLHLQIRGSGPVQHAVVNGAVVQLRPDGAVRLPRDFVGGSILLE
jgi:hypothetical protein